MSRQNLLVIAIDSWADLPRKPSGAGSVVFEQLMSKTQAAQTDLRSKRCAVEKNDLMHVRIFRISTDGALPGVIVLFVQFLAVSV